MALPPLLTQFLHRLDDIARGTGEAGEGPLRVALRANDQERLQPQDHARAAFLALEGTATELEAAAEGLGSILEGRPVGQDLWLDIRVIGPHAPTWPLELGFVTARLTWRTGRAWPEAGGVRDLHERIAGTLALEPSVPEGERDAFAEWANDLPTVDRAASLLATGPGATTRTLEETIDSWGSMALERGWTVGAGVTVRPGLPLDPLSPWNVLHEASRAAFREKDVHCPWPFLMVRVDESEGRGLCPRPDGPRLADGSGGWNGTFARGIRQAFLAARPEGICENCEIPARLRARNRTSFEPIEDDAFPV